MVIIKNVEAPRAESNRLRRSLRGMLMPVDLIMATPEQIDRYGYIVGYIWPGKIENTNEDLMATQEIYNFIQVNKTLSTGGQPTEDQIRSAAAEGFTTVINLATFHPGESLEDEAGLVRSLGMTYYAIPVVWNNPQYSDFTTFEKVLQQLPTGKALVHCAANFRVTAFYSLYALKHLGWSQAQAEAFRTQIWEGSEFPVWEQFIGALTKLISEKIDPG